MLALVCSGANHDGSDSLAVAVVGMAKPALINSAQHMTGCWLDEFFAQTATVPGFIALEGNCHGMREWTHCLQLLDNRPLYHRSTWSDACVHEFDQTMKSSTKTIESGSNSDFGNRVRRGSSVRENFWSALRLFASSAICQSKASGASKSSSTVQA